MKKKVTIHDIKAALLDDRFRSALPEELQEDVSKFLKNPNCSCNHSIYLNVMKKASKQILAYYPNKEETKIDDVKNEINTSNTNQWQVINCSINELPFKLRELGPGRKQLDVARWQDQVTVIINHLDGIH